MTGSLLAIQSVLGRQRVAPGRFDYSLGQFLFFAVALVGLTLAGLYVARRRREALDARLGESSGGWRIRTELDFDLPDPFSRFPGLALARPRQVMEGIDDGFEVAYFDVSVGRKAALVERPCALVQLPMDPPRGPLDLRLGPPGPAVLEPWGAAARAVLATERGFHVATAPLAILVQSDGASSATVQRVALALAKAIVTDATSGRATST